MTTLRVALADRTRSTENELNTTVSSNDAGSPTTIAKKQNNPYAGAVLPTGMGLEVPTFQQQQQLQQQQYNYPTAAYRTPPPVLNNNRVRSSFPTSNPYTMAREALVAPLSRGTAAAPQLTKMYVDGRPVPVRKAEAASLVAAVVTLSFRRRTGVYWMDLKQTLSKPVDYCSQLLGMHVIVEGDRGVDLGCISAAELPVANDENMSRVRRLATEAELSRMAQVIPIEEQRALRVAREEAAIALPYAESFELTDAVFQFDQKKLTIWYTSPDRVYFVPLLRALNQVYHCRIWMERVGGDPDRIDEQRMSSPMKAQNGKHNQ